MSSNNALPFSHFSGCRSPAGVVIDPTWKKGTHWRIWILSSSSQGECEPLVLKNVVLVSMKGAK